MAQVSLKAFQKEQFQLPRIFNVLYGKTGMHCSADHVQVSMCMCLHVRMCFRVEVPFIEVLNQLSNLYPADRVKW